jgi:hypothetical protein
MITSTRTDDGTSAQDLVSKQNAAVNRLHELNDMLNGLGSSMLSIALEQGQILTEERAKYPARAKKGRVRLDGLPYRCGNRPGGSTSQDGAVGRSGKIKPTR